MGSFGLGWFCFFHAKSLVALLEGFTKAYQKNLAFGKKGIGFACFGVEMWWKSGKTGFCDHGRVSF
jgi:hypothetical protein